jgi:hypothetical protein
MKFYIFGSANFFQKSFQKKIIEIANQVSTTTNTDDLVVALYVVPKSNWSGGTAYAQGWSTLNKFRTGRGKWNITQQYNTPKDLPAQFKLIRLLLRHNFSNYPLRERDYYGWEHNYGTFYDHFAFLFAHELHHFRRFHLGFHPGEGENSANKWALQRVKSLNFNVESKKLKTLKKKRSKKKTLVFQHVLNPKDFIDMNALPGETGWKQVLNSLFLNISPQKKKQYVEEKLSQFEKLRSLAPGSKLTIHYDPKQKYTGQAATLVRPLRKNSFRIVIRTNDGKEWRWPMAWLK